jgi:hypothetical protein
MRNRTGLPWMGLAVGLSTAVLGATWLGLARMTGEGPGGLAILGGLSLLALVMAGRCGRAALVLSRAAAGRCGECGALRAGAATCARCGAG